MNKIIFLILAITTSMVDADVFKCKSANGSAEYKLGPCASSEAEQGVLAIKPKNPRREEQAQIRLKNWQDEQDANEKRKMDIEKAQQIELEKQQAELEKQQALINKQIELDALTRSAAAAEAQALAIQRIANKPLANDDMQPNPDIIQKHSKIEHKNRLNNNRLHKSQHKYDQQDQQFLNNDIDADDSDRHRHEELHQRRRTE